MKPKKKIFLLLLAFLSVSAFSSEKKRVKLPELRLHKQGINAQVRSPRSLALIERKRYERKSVKEHLSFRKNLGLAPSSSRSNKPLPGRVFHPKTGNITVSARPGRKRFQLKTVGEVETYTNLRTLEKYLHLTKNFWNKQEKESFKELISFCRSQEARSAVFLFLGLGLDLEDLLPEELKQAALNLDLMTAEEELSLEELRVKLKTLIHSDSILPAHLR